MKKYIKSPLNYVGGKFKLLEEMLALFPENINTFVDLFGGGFNVGINIDSKHAVYNDIDTNVTNLLKHLYTNDVEEVLAAIDGLIEKFNLSKTNAEGFAQLRYYYNQNTSDPIAFYTLICFAFNNQIRYNKAGEFNMTFGKERSSFNPSLRAKFIEFVKTLQTKECSFHDKTFKDFDFSNLRQDDFVYADPPYFNSVQHLRI